MRCGRRRQRRGMSLIELMAALLVMGLVTTAVLGLTLTSGRAVDRRTREGSMGAWARSSLDEMLCELRAAREISASETSGGTNFTSTAASGIVLRAPSYNAASPQGILDGFDDLVSFRYDAATRTLRETTVRDRADSDRPVRTNFIVAQNVQSVAFQYRVRDQFDGNGSNLYVLRANASITASTPLTAYVNGVETPLLIYVAGTKTATLERATPPTKNDDVQFQYTISPGAVAGDFAVVNGVDVTLALQEIDGTNVARTITLAGNARLRNRRN